MHCQGDLWLTGGIRDSISRLYQNIRFASQDKFFIISQANSWSRLNISMDMFCMLAQYCSSSPAFLNLALELGFKISDTEENCGTLYYRLHSSDKDCQIESYEITYSVRYIEEHGRDELIDPWSLRHVVVHQRYFFTKNLSTWVVIQVPSSIRGQLERAISAAGSIGRLPAAAGPHPMALHALFLISSQRHWDAYIKYLFEQHAEMVTLARPTRRS